MRQSQGPVQAGAERGSGVFLFRQRQSGLGVAAATKTRSGQVHSTKMKGNSKKFS